MSVFTNPASGAAGHAAAYVVAVLDLVGDRDPLSVMRETIDVLPQAIAGLSPQQLRQPERPGKWSVAQVLQHLADSEIVTAWRIRLILAQDRPPLTGTTRTCGPIASATPTPIRWPRWNCSPSCAAQTCACTNARRPTDLNRVGLHVERGEESIGHLRRLAAGHDLLHRRQIERIRQTVS